MKIVSHTDIPTAKETAAVVQGVHSELQAYDEVRFRYVIACRTIVLPTR